MYAHGKVRPEGLPLVAQLPASDAKANDDAPYDLFNHSLEPLLDVSVIACAFQP